MHIPAQKLTLKERIKYFTGRLKGIPILTDLRPYIKIIEKIKSFRFSDLSDEGITLHGKTLQERVMAGEPLDSLLAETYALAAEAAGRTISLSPFDVQLIAGIAMHQGNCAQMLTGEGKTLAAVFPAVLNAMTGKGVHILTANDYLARRDAKWMGPVYEMCGLKAAFVYEGMTADQRREAYNADVTYVTARESGFDFLRDGLCYNKNDMVHRDLDYVIVDEADFLLIDEARTPLVIAGSIDEIDIDPLQINAIIPRLKIGRDFTVDKKKSAIHVALQGENTIGLLLGCGGRHEPEYEQIHAAVHAALYAWWLLEKDRDYIIKNGKIELVDEFTGRTAKDRKWPYGIQTALEAKENLEIHPEGCVFGTITVQNFISQYQKVAAMTATAATAAEELKNCYGCGTVVIPPNLPVKRNDLNDRIFRTKKNKMKMLVSEIAKIRRTGRPVLVGTGTIIESEQLAAQLKAEGISCAVLNAKNNYDEAEIIKQAGMPGAVTISTNMAGRGTDIKPGGDDQQLRKKVISLGGLYVIGTNRHESARIDFQLRGRAGRQGDPGSSQYFVSLEDSLFEKYGIAEFLPKGSLNLNDNDGCIIDEKVSSEIDRAQRIVESVHGKMRKSLRRYTAIIEKQRQYISSIRKSALLSNTLPEEFGELFITQCEKTVDKNAIVKKFLSSIDKFWADHLLDVEEIKEGLYLQHYSGRNPFYEYIRFVHEQFEKGIEHTFSEIKLWVQEYIMNPGRMSEADVPCGPTSTWTYIIDEEPFPAFAVSMFGGAVKPLGALQKMFGLENNPFSGTSKK